MFEEENTNKEPVDIFSSTDPVKRPAPGSSPVLPQDNGTPLPVQPVPASRGLVVAAIVVVIVVVILVAVIVGFWLVRRGQPATTTVNQAETVIETTPEEPSFENSVQDLLPEESLVEEEPEEVDTDNDGLTDKEEQLLGTSVIVDDSDGDGLSDGEEVNTWKTDPLEPDTDGDGFSDGAEVEGSYDPLQGGGARLDSFETENK